MRTVRNSNRLPGGVPTQGVPARELCLPGVYLPMGGVPARVVPAGGCTCPGVYLAGEGGVPDQVLPPREQNDWQTGVKT